MGLVEKYRFPRARKVLGICRRIEPGPQRRQLFGRRKDTLEPAHPLLDLRAVAVRSLKYRVQLAPDDRALRALDDDRFKISRNSEPQKKGLVTFVIELVNHAGQGRFRVDNVGSRQGHPIGPAGIAS